jgi:hypothetical protein
VREWLKAEFNGELVVIDHKVLGIGKSTKGREALNAFPERVIGWLIDNYAPPAEALDAKKFKVWRDTIFPTGVEDNYIDYLKSIGTL